MSKKAVKRGTTGYRSLVVLRDSSSTTGALKTGSTNAHVSIAYTKDNLASVSVTTIDLITDPAAAVVSTSTEAGFGTSGDPGVYHFQPPDNAFSAGTARSVVFTIKDSDGTHNIAPVALEYELVAYDPDAYVDVDGTGKVSVGTVGADAITSSAIADAALDAATFAADAKGSYVRNVAVTGFSFKMIDSTDHVAPKLSLGGAFTVATYSQNGGNWTAIAAGVGGISEVSGAGLGKGFYKINLAQAEMNAVRVDLHFEATGADNTDITIITHAAP